jgi:alpha-tubulin suppressor-like RCC1 family protein
MWNKMQKFDDTQLGAGEDRQHNQRKRIVEVSAGDSHTVAPTDAGEVYTFGHNNKSNEVASISWEHIRWMITRGSERFVAVLAGALDSRDRVWETVHVGVTNLARNQQVYILSYITLKLQH